MLVLGWGTGKRCFDGSGLREENAPLLPLVTWEGSIFDLRRLGVEGMYFSSLGTTRLATRAGQTLDPLFLTSLSLISKLGFDGS